MNILLTSTAYPPSMGGAQLLHHKTAMHLNHRHDVQVASLWDSVRSDWLSGTTINAHRESWQYEVDGVRVKRIGISTREKVRLVPFAAGFYPLMNQVTPYISGVYLPHLRQSGRVDVVHNVRIGRVPFSYASRQIALENDAPFILTPVHHPRWTGWRYRAWLDLYRAADGVIALTKSEKKTLSLLGVDESRIHVTGMGPILADSADPQHFRSKYNLGHSPIVLFLGQHRSYKGYQQLLDATKDVWQKHPDTRFVFAGPAIKDSESYFEDKDARIVRTGSIDLQTKTDALAACTVLCLPSSQESFGGVYVEAWCFEKPVIGCHIPAVSEVIDDGENGFLIAQDGRQIADRINLLLDSPSMSEKMGKAGYDKVAKEYTWEKLGMLTETIYGKVSTGR